VQSRRRNAKALGETIALVAADAIGSAPATGKPEEGGIGEMIRDATPVWAEGYVDRLSGFERQDNPYGDCKDERADQWDDGWLFAAGEIIRGALSEPEKLQRQVSDR
jgi:hypothetical protein